MGEVEDNLLKVSRLLVEQAEIALKMSSMPVYPPVFLDSGDGPEFLSGQEWYERFIHEALQIADDDLGNTVILGKAYREAAKRASGIEEPGK